VSKRSRAQAKDDRLKKKRGAKEAARARYASYRDQGITKGSRRQKEKSKRRLVRVWRHPLGACGNVGCPRCSPVAQRLALKGVGHAA